METLIEEKINQLLALADKYDLPLAMVLHAYSGAKHSGQEKILMNAIANCIVNELKPAIEEAQAKRN